MKRKIIFSACLVLAALLTWAATAAAGNYLSLTPGAEKWFTAVETGIQPFHRMHTLVTTYNGNLLKMRREILEGNMVTEGEDRLFSLGAGGDIYYHGDLQNQVYDTPVLWVDAPLTVGKAWHQSVLLSGTPDSPDDTAVYEHFMFLVLDKGAVDCPLGTYQCYRVALTRILPDDQIINCFFWYNDQMGLVRCCEGDSPLFSLVKAVDGDPIDDGNHEIDNPVGDEGLIGGLLGAPNPATPSSYVSFSLKDAARVEVAVYDVAGRLVKRLVQDEFMTAGPARILWLGDDQAGRAVASGTYLVTVKAGQEVSTQRITLVR